MGFCTSSLRTIQPHSLSLATPCPCSHDISTKHAKSQSIHRSSSRRKVSLHSPAKDNYTEAACYCSGMLLGTLTLSNQATRHHCWCNMVQLHVFRVLTSANRENTRNSDRRVSSGPTNRANCDITNHCIVEPWSCYATKPTLSGAFDAPCSFKLCKSVDSNHCIGESHQYQVVPG